MRSNLALFVTSSGSFLMSKLSEVLHIPALFGAQVRGLWKQTQ